MKIGVLALQGDFKEHIFVLHSFGVETVEVRVPKDLDLISGLIIPGGESTTIGKLMSLYGLNKAIIRKNKQGMPIYGTCAGAILLANKIEESAQPKLGLLGVSIRRNDYGRQIDSFEAKFDSKIGRLSGVFIRAPMISSIGKNVEVLAEFEKFPVIVREGNILASIFHPELANELAIHKYFIQMVKKSQK